MRGNRGDIKGHARGKKACALFVPVYAIVAVVSLGVIVVALGVGVLGGVCCFVWWAPATRSFRFITSIYFRGS